jgi:nicotinamide-nucleotide amidase
MRFPHDIAELAEKVLFAYRHKKKRIVTAESCTGGLLAAALTSIAGSSDVFERGFVSYSYDSKTDLLGVEPGLIRQFGVVSPEVAEAMAQGALAYSLADCALSVTGIAGPGGGLPNKPVGLVYFGVATRDGACFHVQAFFQGDRDTVRLQSVIEGLTLLHSLVVEDSTP